jgi:nitrite reductase/ring-hydroxylating ferredoxin subunit
MVAGLFAADALASPALARAESVGEIRPRGVNGTQRMYPVPTANSISIDVDNDVILARWQDRVYAFSLRCPHRGTRLQWLTGEQRIFCPKHKARFRGDGQHDSGRQSRDLDRYAIGLNGSAAAVDLAVAYRADTEPEAWSRAVLVMA